MEITSLLTAGSPSPLLIPEVFYSGAGLDRLALNQGSPLETVGLPRPDDRLTMLRQLQWMEPLLDMLERLLGFGNTELAAPPPPAPPTVAPPVTTGPVGEAPPTPTPPTTTPSGMKSGAPPGYKVMTGKIPSGVVAKAQSLLSQPMGSEHPFEVEGKRYFARLEHHYHPPGYQGGPNGWHKGCTVYQAN